ncbi:MAG TPA: cupin domain-containing protein [Alphaproteobacteria bacterium]|nr:cupin domain-containing protein [Alphaproteobacteria bacterium]
MLIVIRSPRTVVATTRLGLLACLAMASVMPGILSTGVAAEPQGFVVLPGSAPRFSGPVGGEANTAEILATREQTGGAFGVWRYTIPAGGGPPVHIHRAEDEFFYVLSGEFNFQLGDCVKSAPAGSFVFIPKGAVQAFQHVGPEPGVLLGAVTPGGFEGLFMDLPHADEDAVRALFKKASYGRRRTAA